MLSSFTGAVSDTFAALSFDSNYQQQRRRNVGVQRSAVQHLTHGGERLFRGVFEGTTGLVMQPIKGARDDGVRGFFKGFGKGLIGIVTKPVVGVIDMTTGTMDMVRHAVQVCCCTFQHTKKTRCDQTFECNFFSLALMSIRRV